MIQLFPPPPPSGGVLFAPPLSAAGRPRPCPSVGSLRSPALWYPKRTSRCSLVRSFRPLRVLRLAVSATGGARLRTPSVAPHISIFRITPPVRAYTRPPARTRARLRAHARYAISPGNSCFFFVENFPFSARRIYTPFIDRLLEKDYNEGW